MAEVEVPGVNEEEVVERLLSERLVEGFLLLEKACPACATPLVKRNSFSPKHSLDHVIQEYDNFTYGAGVDTVAYESPIQPLLGVPFCVSCQAHVVTTPDEVQLLEAADHLKVRGTIMVAMSRESLEDESVMTIDGEPEPLDKVGVARSKKSTNAAVKEKDSMRVKGEQRESRPPILVNDGGIYDRDHFSFSASLVAHNRTIESNEGNSGGHLQENEKLRKDASMLDDEDEISLQEIEVVHLDDATAGSETERQILQRSDSAKTSERLVIKDCEVKSAHETTVDDEDATFHTMQSQSVEPNPLRKGRFEADSFGNASIAVLRSENSVPIQATESRANTSIAVLREDISFPIRSGESPANTSLAVLRGDPSFPTRLTSSHDEFSSKHVDEASTSPLKRYAAVPGKHKNGGKEINPTPTQEATPTTEREVILDVDRHRSLITQSDDSGSPNSQFQNHESLPLPPINSQPNSLNSRPPLNSQPNSLNTTERLQSKTPGINNPQQETIEQHQDVPIESLVSYEERRAIATRILGKKMIQGYSLTEHKCIKCQMPLMEKEKVFYCVVCPILRQQHAKLPAPVPVREATEALEATTIGQSPKASREIIQRQSHPKVIVESVSSDSIPSPENHAIHSTVTTTMEDLAAKASSPRHASTPKALLTERNVPNEVVQKSSANNSSAPTKASKKSKSSHKHVATGKMETTSAHASNSANQAKQMKARLTTIHTSANNSFTSSPDRQVEAATQTSPAVNSDKLPETYQRKSFPLHPSNESNHAASQSDQASKAPDPPSTFFAEAPDDESARMSSITESYVTTFSLGTSRKSVHREQLPKVRSNKPSLQNYLHTAKATARAAVLEKAGSYATHESSRKPSIAAQSRVSKQGTIGTKSVLKEDPCMQTLREYSAILPFQVKQTPEYTGSHERQDQALDVPLVGGVTSTSPVATEEIPKEIVGRFSQYDEDQSIAASKREQNEQLIRKKAKQLLELEKARKAHETAGTESKSGSRTDFSMVMKQQIMQEEIRVQREIEAAEKSLEAAQLEEKRIIDERNSYEEALRLAEMEQNAERQQKEAEEAMEKARLAIDQLSAARQQVLADTIAEGAAAAVTEAESINRSLAEDYHNNTQRPTTADINRERWDVLRSEGRLTLTRRVMAGWKVLPELCKGVECENVPLLLDGNVKQCVICGGSGNGLDGVYALPFPEDDDDEDADPSIESSRVQPPKEIETPRLDISSPTTKPKDDVVLTYLPSQMPEVSVRNVANLQENFESKRAMVTKEIGERMMKGWNLLDASCPYCVMPLMTDLDQKKEICVLCGVVGAIVPKSSDRSVKTWTKGEIVHASRRPKDEKKKASASRMSVSMNSRQSIPNQSEITNTTSKTGDNAERKRLKRELLREIIAETTAMMRKRSAKESQVSKPQGTSKDGRPTQNDLTMAIANTGKNSKKERLREIVIQETKRATERLKRNSDEHKEPEVAKASVTPTNKHAGESSKVSVAGARGGSTVASRDPAPSYDAQPRSLILHDRDEGSRADPPATQSVSIRNKQAVEPDGTATWQEPIENLDLIEAAVKSADDSEYEEVQMEGGLSPTNPPSVFVLEIPKGFDVNNEYSLRELIKTATQSKNVTRAPKALDVDTKLDIHHSEHRMIQPSPGMTEATLPETSSPTHSKRTAKSDASNRATYAGKVKGRATAPTPSPGISVAPEPEFDARTRRSSHSHGASFLPTSMRPATSPGMDSIERMKPAASPGMDAIVEDPVYEDESFVGIPMSKSAPARTHPLRRRMSPERIRFNERKNRVSAVRPKHPELNHEPAEARTDVSNVGSQSRRGGTTDTDDDRDRVPHPEPARDSTTAAAFTVRSRGFSSTKEGLDQASSHASQVSWGSRPRVTPESIMRPRSTRSATEDDSLGDLRAGTIANQSESDERRLRLARGIRSDSGSTSICTSRAISGGPLSFPAAPPPSSSSQSNRGRTLLVQGELPQSPSGDDRHLLRPEPFVVVQGEPAGGNEDRSTLVHRRHFPPEEEEQLVPRTVLTSREVIVVEGGPLNPSHRVHRVDRADWGDEIRDNDGDDGVEEDEDDDDQGRFPTAHRSWQRRAGAGGSPTGSVGSATLDAVLARIEETKKQLQNAPTVTSHSHSGGGSGIGGGGSGTRGPFEKPQKLRQLIDNLAAAAEEIEKQDRLDMSMCF